MVERAAEQILAVVAETLQGCRAPMEKGFRVKGIYAE